MKQERESAVSPVIGVMLMLVVVIIIAAVVSGFAGGLVGTETKPPQATIQGKYSFSADLFQLYHAGGDQLSTQKLIIKVSQNDEDWGGYMSLFSQMGTSGAGLNIANKSRIYNTAGTKAWLDPATGAYNIPVFRPGETMYYNESFKSAISSLDPVGKSLILEFDTIDGKLISKSKVLIEP
jgi:archaeal type IV pilus assembly protein PilA